MIERSAEVEIHDAIVRLWQLLPRLRRLSFTADPGPGSVTAWQGRGYADIKVTPASGGWRLTEWGHFWPEGAARGLALRNSYRWQWFGERLRLYHERLGVDQAVFLFDVVAVDAASLVCESPHLCGDDRYHGSIKIMRQGFDFAWTIAGPRKNEQLLYRYRT